MKIDFFAYLSVCVCLLFAGYSPPTYSSATTDTYKLTDSHWDVADDFYRPTIAFSPDGKSMALAGSIDNGQGRIHLWDTALGKRTFMIDSVTRVTTALFTPDSKGLMTGHKQGLFFIWDVATGKVRKDHRFQNETWVRAMALSPDGTQLAVGGQSGQLSLLNAHTLEPIWSIKAHHFGLSDIKFSADAQLIYTVGDDQRIYIWRAADGKPFEKMKELNRTPTQAKAHRGMVKTIVLIDNKALSGAYWEGGNAKSYTGVAPPDKILRLWDITTGEAIDSFPLIWGIACCISRINQTHQVMFVNNADWGLMRATLKIFDIDTRKIVNSFSDDDLERDPSSQGIQNFGLVPHSHKVVIGLRSGRYLLWDFKTNKVLGAFISTDAGWLVINQNQEYDGTSLEKLNSESDDKKPIITHYKQVPGLFNRLLSSSNKRSDSK